MVEFRRVTAKLFLSLIAFYICFVICILFKTCYSNLFLNDCHGSPNIFVEHNFGIEFEFGFYLKINIW